MQLQNWIIFYTKNISVVGISGRQLNTKKQKNFFKWKKQKK